MYVEPTNLLEAIKKPKALFQRIVFKENVILVRPLFLPLHYKVKLTQKVDRFITSLLLKRILRKQGRQSFDVTWLYRPHFNFVVSIVPSDLLVYDCNDEFTEFYSNEPLRTWVEREEVEVLKKADIVFATAKRLLTKCKEINSNVYLATNGVPSYFFETDDATPPGMKDLKAPIIGFVGTIADWLDFDLLYALARENVDWTFMFIGPISSQNTKLRALKTLRNVFFLGQMRHDQIPRYIRHCNACLIPFKIGDLTQSANPVKLFEYLALGVPVVSTAIDEVVEFADIICVANDHDFSEKIRAAISSNTSASRQTRIATARQYTWDKIVEHIETIIISKRAD